MIGDRSDDMRAAHEARIRAVGVMWGYGTREELERAGADTLIESPSALVACVRSLQHARGVRL